MNEGIVFDGAQGELGTLNGVTLGVVLLAVDDFDTDLVGSMATVSELTAWFIDGDPRGTAEVSYADESGSGVVRYATGPPSFDIAGVDLVNAVGFYKPDDDTLQFAIPIEPGPGFDAWTPDEPSRGLARVRRASPSTGGAVAKVAGVGADASGDVPAAELAAALAPLLAGSGITVVDGQLTVVGGGSGERVGSSELVDLTGTSTPTLDMDDQDWSSALLLVKVDDDATIALSSWPDSDTQTVRRLLILSDTGDGDVTVQFVGPVANGSTVTVPGAAAVTVAPSGGAWTVMGVYPLAGFDLTPVYAAIDAVTAALAAHEAETTTAHGGIVAEGDSRLTDARTPTAHVHSGSDITSGTVATARLSVGTGSGTVAAGNDSRFTDARTPSTGGSNDDLMQRKSGAWSNRTPAQVGVDLPVWQRKISIANTDYPSSVTGTWTFNQSSAMIAGGYWATASTADQAIGWAQLGFSSGTFTLDVWTRDSTNTGIITVKLGGTTVGTIDTYAGSLATNVRHSLTGITVSANGYLDLELSNPTKNGSSSAYTLGIIALVFRRTGP